MERSGGGFLAERWKWCVCEGVGVVGECRQSYSSSALEIGNVSRLQSVQE